MEATPQVVLCMLRGDIVMHEEGGVFSTLECNELGRK